MIVVKLQGGLGNQMFQYAAGRTLAHRFDVPLKLDISPYPDHLGRVYELANYPICECFATPKEVCHLHWKRDVFWKRVLRRLTRQRNRNPIEAKSYFKEETPCNFSPRFKNLESPVLLEGYWQSWKYFEEIEKVIQRELTPQVDSVQAVNALENSIKENTHSVSLHIRRGDYASVEKTRNKHGVLSMDYYLRAVSIIKEYVRDPKFFVFSDEPEWAHANITFIDSATFIPKGNSPCQDLHLMSCCQNHIIANSSFSWWGAWLSKSDDKTIISPKQWFADEASNKNTKDLIPPQWIRC